MRNLSITNKTHKIIPILIKELHNKELPYPTRAKDPFRILISSVISTRTKDEVTLKVSLKLFNNADTPDKIVKLKQKTIENLIYPCGFYKTKARNIQKLSKILIDSFNGSVPDNFDDLIKLPGVGRKCANLVLSNAFNKYVICVDTHVHRISNRIGLVNTINPFETEKALMLILPQKYWRQINTLFVLFGQTICKPISPECDICPINRYCNYFLL